MDSLALDVLAFWFGRDGEYGKRHARWFSKDPAFDAEVRDRYLGLYEAQMRERGWMGEPRACLARILVLDQFPRNMFRGTARAFANNGIPVETVHKIHEGRPHVLDLIKNQQVSLIINTLSGRMERTDDRQIRSSAVSYKVPCITTLAAASATIQGLEWIKNRPLEPQPIQDYQATLAR